MDWPNDLPIRKVISATSPNAAGRIMARFSAATFSTTNPTTLMVYYFPFGLEVPFDVRLLWWYNGATVAGNVDVGLFAADGTKILSSGSTAMSGVSTMQSVSVTETMLTPGLYYCGFVSDSATAKFVSSGPALTTGQMAGLANETLGAMPLPATMTPVSYATNAFFPVFGITSQTTI